MSNAGFQVVCLDPPAKGWVEKLRQLLSHKGEPFISDIVLRLQGRCKSVSQDHFYVASVGGKVAGSAWYTCGRGVPEVGLLGHVYTQERFRRMGIGTELVSKALGEFIEGGGEWMSLATDNPAARRIYQRAGFRKRGDILMVWERGPRGRFLNQYYRGRPAEFRKMHRGDLARVSLLINRGDSFARELVQAMSGRQEWVEKDFLTLLGAAEAGLGDALAIEVEDRAVAGVAFSWSEGKRPSWRQAEMYVHPAHHNLRAELFERVAKSAARAGARGLYMLASEASGRVELLGRMGFKKGGPIEDMGLDRTKLHGLDLYTLELKTK